MSESELPAKVARLEAQIESQQRQIDHLFTRIERTDGSIDRIADVNANIASVLAVHEVKDKQLVADFKELDADIKTNRAEIREEVAKNSKRLDHLEKWRWITHGITLTVGIAASAAASFFGVKFH